MAALNPFLAGCHAAELHADAGTLPGAAAPTPPCINGDRLGSFPLAGSVQGKISSLTQHRW